MWEGTKVTAANLISVVNASSPGALCWLRRPLQKLLELAISQGGPWRSFNSPRIANILIQEGHGVLSIALELQTYLFRSCAGNNEVSRPSGLASKHLLQAAWRSCINWPACSFLKAVERRTLQQYWNRCWRSSADPHPRRPFWCPHLSACCIPFFRRLGRECVKFCQCMSQCMAFELGQRCRQSGTTGARHDDGFRVTQGTLQSN